ncbi:acetyl-CoA synthetase-like protein [Phlegmacium glaucopus]|nr:acetyl-CoA synthetase-like protein [Phlegmacium glaucopus]
MTTTFTPLPFKPPIPLPEYFFRVAQKYPEREVILVLQDFTSDQDTALISVTWTQFLSDVCRRADYLIRVTGFAPRKRGDPPFVIGLLGRNGYQYCLDFTAILLLRWTVLFISNRNSSEAVRHLMLSTGAKCLLVDQALESTFVDIGHVSYATVSITKESTPIPLANGSSAWHTWLHAIESSTEERDYEAQETCIYMHTSGSTGHPKAIAWSHEFMLSKAMSIAHDRASRVGSPIYTCLPLFHGGGFTTCYANILGCGGVCIIVDTDKPVSSESVLRHLRVLQHRDIDAFLPPSILEDIVDLDGPSHESLAVLQSVRTVTWGGAPLRKDVGDFLIREGVRIVAWCGVTEAGVLARSCYDPESDPSDWPYLRLVDSFEFNFEPIDSDDDGAGHHYSLVISPGYVVPPIINHDKPRGFLTNDLWERHPKKPDLWRIKGRLDDVTVLSNGEKTDNRQLEVALCASPLVSQAIIFGTGRFLNGAILLPRSSLAYDSADSVATYLANVWPHIEHVNRIIPQHSRLIRPLVLVAKPDKPFLVSDKGTVKSKASLALYEEEINVAYIDLENGADMKMSFNPRDRGSTKQFIGALISDALGHAVEVDDDVFIAGLDSLLATSVRSSLNAALKHAGYFETLPKNIVYSYPTVTSLGDYIQRIIDTGASHISTNPAHETELQTQIEQLISSYTSQFPDHHAESPYVLQEGDVYAVTGTTGSLGAAFISTLLDKPQVRKVYLLNRPNKNVSMAQRHQDSFKIKGLDYTKLAAALCSGKAVYLEIDLGKKMLGFDTRVYDELASQVTHIVHIAWTIDSKRILSSFQTHIAGVRHLIDLALSSKHVLLPHLTFLSSIAVVGHWPAEQLILEKSLNSPDFCYHQGYSYAKYISEKIIEAAVAQRPGFRASIVRSGQIAGALDTGAWPRNEYMPSLMQGSVYLRMVPKDLRTMHWLPVDIAADILFHQIQHSASLDTRAFPTFYNLENAKSTPWSLVARVLETFDPDVLVRQIPFKEWLEHVRKNPENPAFKVTAFLEDFVYTRSNPSMDTTNSRKACGGLVDYELGEGLIKSYVMFACAELKRNVA